MRKYKLKSKLNNYIWSPYDENAILLKFPVYFDQLPHWKVDVGLLRSSRVNLPKFCWIQKSSVVTASLVEHTCLKNVTIFSVALQKALL